ncbi:hypothetical protein DSM101010T_34790 [Desulfovibrio subterraneus]|uniref:Uncharacterized protein n=1 Tax=Desulfovibrio subterraneus TaxID=2718620 RepID=A0A7J0BPX1_9BACT|nr:hypothetical protein DSM101010T_34790 [Desulfovibrio subterraneus]
MAPARVELLASARRYLSKTVERAFLFIGQVEHTFVKVYLAWRGTEEDVKKKTWTSHESVLLDAIAQIKSIHLQKR